MHGNSKPDGFKRYGRNAHHQSEWYGDSVRRYCYADFKCRNLVCVEQRIYRAERCCGYRWLYGKSY